MVIESPFVRVMVKDVQSPRVTLPKPNKEEGHVTLGNVMGMNTLWSCKFLRKA